MWVTPHVKVVLYLASSNVANMLGYQYSTCCAFAYFCLVMSQYVQSRNNSDKINFTLSQELSDAARNLTARCYASTV